MSARYFLDTDDDGHWYLVPVVNRIEWEAWSNIQSDDERAWDPPGFAERLGGAPQRVTFTNPRNGDDDDCQHVAVVAGPRAPLRYGTAATQICADCGAWRQDHHRVGPWQPPETYSLRFVSEDDGELQNTIMPTVEPMVPAEARVAELEAAIRTHRDAKGNDRCWLDDRDLYAVLGDVEADTSLPPRETFLANCARYYECRRKPEDGHE